MVQVSEKEFNFLDYLKRCELSSLRMEIVGLGGSAASYADICLPVLAALQAQLWSEPTPCCCTPTHRTAPTPTTAWPRCCTGWPTTSTWKPFFSSSHSSASSTVCLVTPLPGPTK